MSIVIPLQELKDAGKTKELKKLLTFVGENKVYYKNKNQSFQEKTKIINMYMVQDGMLHIPYTFAKNYFSGTSFEKYLTDKEYPDLFKDKSGKFKGTLREYQLEPYKEAKKYIKREKTITFDLFTSFGKTFFGSIFSWYLNAYTVILVHRKILIKSWLTTYQNSLDIPEDQIVIVDKKINEKKKGQKKSPAEKGKIFICMESRWEHIPQFVRDKIKLLIIDEAHSFCTASRVPALLFLQPKYIIAQTATLERVTDGLETAIQSVCGIHNVSRENTKTIKFYVVMTSLNFSIEGDKNKFGELVQKQTESEERNKIILDLVQKHSEFKTMMIGKRKNHCTFLKQELEKRGLECSTLFGNQKKCESKNVLIGTDSKMGTGFDEANACENYDGSPSELLYILHTYATKAVFKQVAGRVLRSKKPKIICFCDENRMTKNHIREMKKWAQEISGQVTTIKTSQISDFQISKN